MSKFLRRSVFALALLCALGGASAARAQRVGPVDEERATTDAAKNAVEKTDAKSADKSAPKTDANKNEAKKTTGDAKLDHTSANAAPPAAPSSPASSPNSNASTTTPAASPSPAAASSTPSSATGSPSIAAAATPLGEKTASNGAGDAKPDPTPTAPAGTLPSLGALPPPPKYESPQPIKADVPAPATQAANSSASAASSVAVPPSAIYRVGAGDILDIRLVGGMSKDITLFTVLANGTIDYPLAGEPVAVLGLTTDEIGARLSAALKRRGIFDRAQFQIGVRDYASHSVMVSGLVDQPGQKVLQREAVPLYVIFAQALPRPDAGRVVVVSRATNRTRTLDLTDPAALNELVSNGDVITVQPRPQEFFYIAGEINAAGQKDYHTGMTLTQAILAAGGVTRAAGKRTIVTVSRQGADGRLVPVEYVLQEIEDGKVPDPRLQPGDRIEVGRRR